MKIILAKRQDEVFEFQIDDDDYERVRVYEWHYSGGYARAQIDGESVSMHRFIMRAARDVLIDHRNRDKSCNCKWNLREATHSQNRCNRPSWGAIPYKGVSRSKNRKNPFTARLYIDGKTIHIGSFPTAEEAAHARDRVAREHHGGFAFLNFPDEDDTQHGNRIGLKRRKGGLDISKHKLREE